MARMVPFPMLPTDSAAERRLYEGFLEQLDDAYVAYHSVDWVLERDGRREEGEADFVLAHPELGVLVLEVKGGSISFDPVGGRWTQRGHSGAHELDEDPFHQAADEMRSLAEILRAQQDWDRWRPSYGFGVALPDGRYERSAHPGAPAEVVIDHGDLRRLAERVPEVMRFWLRPDRRFGAEGMEALAMALGYRVEVRLPLGLRFAEEDKKIVELTGDQAWTLAFVANRTRAAITGPAGSGKTMLAVQIAKRLSARGHATLLTCVNPRLAEHLRELTGTVSNLDVLSFHEVCVRTAREAGLVPASDAAEAGTRDLEHELPDLLVEAARKLGPRYEAIVADEGQAFRAWWWPALLSLHRDPDRGRLFVFADDAHDLPTDVLPVADGARVGPLPHNLRSTEPIGRFVSIFYEGDRPALHGPPGRPVEILDYEDDEGLVRLLAAVLRNLIEQERIPMEEVAVLTPSRGKSRVRARAEVGGYRLSEEVEPGRILATSIDAFAGLERPVVILAELDDPHGEDLERDLYVGGSRARDHLIVLAREPVARELRRRAGVRPS